MMNRVSKAAALLWLAGAMCLLGSARVAYSQTTVVNCDQADLEEALQDAMAGDGYIVFECDGTILITNTMVISTNITLDATDRNITIASPGATNGVRLFTVMQSFEAESDEDETNIVTLELINLKLADGNSTNGGAIYLGSNTVLLATQCVFSNNVAIGTNGVSGSSASTNATKIRGSGGNGGRSGGLAYGGAIYNLGSATFNECSFLTNAAVGGDGGNGGNGGAGNTVGGAGGNGGRGGSAYGGAIYNRGELFITNSTFNLNLAASGSGGDGGAGGAAPFAGANGKGGGAGGASGAAILTQKGYSAVIVNSTFALNGATAGDSSDAPGAAGRAPSGGTGGSSSGGGLANYGTNVLINCTFFANSVTGGSGGNGGESATVGGKGGSGGAAWGGNVFSGGKRSVLYATNCTLTDGSAIGGTNGLGGSAPFPGKNGPRGPSRGGNVSSSNSVLWLKNTLIAYPAVGTNAYGKIKDGGYNLLSDRSIKFTKTSTSRATNATPVTNELRIGVLARNGGPVETVEIFTNSPAVNRADPTNSPLTDARGILRDVCDIGAYEAGYILGPPRILVAPVKRTVREAGDVTFNVVAVGDPPLLYQWFFGDVEIDGATASSYTLIGADADSEGNYSVRVSNNSGATNSVPVALDVLLPPSFEEEPVDTIADTGGTFILEAIASGDAPLTYQWYFNNVIQLGAVLNTFTVVNAQVTNAGLYHVRVCNPHGCITSEQVTVTVVDTPPSIISVTPTNNLVAQPKTATFTGLAEGSRPWGFLWFFNGSLVRSNLSAPSDIDVLNIRDSDAADQGSYVLVVTNAFGGATSGPVTLTVQTEPPTIDVQPESFDIVAGTNVTFGVTALGSAPLNYRWYFNSNSISGATNSFLVVTNASSTNDGFYHVIVTNLLGSVTSVVATLTVETLVPTILSQPTNVTVAVGQNATITINASGSALRYQWYFNNNPISGATTRQLTIANAQTTNAGSYRVVVTNLLGSANSAPITLNVQTTGASINSQPANQSVFTGQNATFTVGAAGSSPLTYRWFFNSNAISGANSSSYTVTAAQAGNAGFYHVVVSNLVGAATSSVATLTVTPGAPVFTTQPSDTAAFTGDDVTLNSVAVGSVPLSYQWYSNAGLLSGQTSASLFLAAVQPSSAGTYRVVASNVSGVTTSSPAVLTVAAPAPAISVQPETVVAAVGTNASFSVTATGRPLLLYQWFFNDSALYAPTNGNFSFTNLATGSLLLFTNTATQSSLTVTDIKTADEGVYRVVITNSAGFAVSDDALLDVAGFGQGN